MTILVIELLYEGIVFGADRNITTQYADGSTTQEKQSPKVLKWPTDNYVFGFAGAARMGSLPMVDWLESLRGEFQELESLQAIATKLHSKVQVQRDTDDADRDPQPLVIHLGGFAKKKGYWVPVVWHIGNIYDVGKFGYLDIRKSFHCNEGPTQLADIDYSEIRRFLKVQAKQFQPFWIHQGIDLLTFNVLGSAIKSAFGLLCAQHPDHDIPTTLTEWEKHVKMQVLMYGAYFEAFKAEGQQYVGGGADIVSIPWPKGR